jgi:hypothetical protein
VIEPKYLNCENKSVRFGSWLLFIAVGLVPFTMGNQVGHATPFVFVSDVDVSPPPPGRGIHGIARVGNEWFMANLDEGWNIYDTGFVQTGTTRIPELGQTRGMVLDTSSGNLFVGDGRADTIFEVSPSGVIQDSFSSAGTGLNALAYNPNDDTLYAVHYGGFVSHLTTMGAPLDDFTITTDKLTGAAWDSESNTLLVLTFDYSHLDLVKEYTTDGELVGTPLAVDAVTGNGQGLHYNSQTGVLHVTSQFGTVALWEREVIPEPSSLLLILIALAVIGGWRKLKRAA